MDGLHWRRFADMRSRLAALAALTLSSALILCFCLVGGEVAAVAFAAVAVVFPVLLMILGSAGPRSLGSRAWPIGALFVIHLDCLAGMLVFVGRVEQGPWLFGLPAAVAIQLYGLLLVPLVLVALGYALTFDSFDVSDDDLDRLRELAELENGD